jgi:D-ribose pyranose/furanose isomerase RbsD
MKQTHAVIFSALILTGILHSCQNVDQLPPVPAELSWKQVLAEDLNLLGHRNWILVVDKAFPEQSSAGMKYLYAGEDLLPTLEHVLKQVKSSTHVTPVVYRDEELAYITEDQVPGIGEFRSSADRILKGYTVNTLLHDDVFERLDESSSLFRVLVIKTNGTLPYTSVFLQLDCSYWGPEDERVLRDRMEAE